MCTQLTCLHCPYVCNLENHTLLHCILIVQLSIPVHTFSPQLHQQCPHSVQVAEAGWYHPVGQVGQLSCMGEQLGPEHFLWE